jgi:pimeloyl-ACP methyl ester carboxylesterase
MPLAFPRSLRLTSLAVALLVTTPAVEAQPQPAGPPPVDQALLPYASTADSVKLPDGRMLHFVCMGEGSPTVILTAGMGDFSAVAWSNIQPDMARITRVCAWDRPGFGLSDGTATPETVETTTADLEAALSTGTIPGPYVMVGHSLGSYESLLYTDRHPDRVVGMVLVDPAIPNQIALFTQLHPNEPAPDPQANPMVQMFHKCAAEIRAGTAKANGPDPDHCFFYPPIWPQASREALVAKVSNPVQYEAMASFGTSDELDSKLVINLARNYRDLPLIVLTSTMDPPPPPGVTPPPLSEQQKTQKAAMDAMWNRGHDELAALSTRGVNARVPGADHYIQRAKPQVVLDAVAEVVREARAAKP